MLEEKNASLQLFVLIIIVKNTKIWNETYHSFQERTYLPHTSAVEFKSSIKEKLDFVGLSNHQDEVFLVDKRFLKI